ncbi:MAG: DUF1501 domain-containing protein [Gemmataceae bacterium]
MCGRFGLPFGDYPAMGAVVSHQLGFRGELPPYVSIPSATRPSPGSWARAFGWAAATNRSRPATPTTRASRVRDVEPRETMAPARAARRQGLLSAIDTLARDIHGSDQLATYGEFQPPPPTSSSPPRSARALSPSSRESTGLRDRHGRNTSPSCLLACRLVEPRRPLRHHQLRRLGPPRPDLTGLGRSFPELTRVSPP